MTETTTIAFTLPWLGEGVNEVTLSRWLRNQGDAITEGEPLLEVATDKVDTEISAPCTGTLERVLAKENDIVEVGAELAFIDRGATAAPSRSPQAPAVAGADPVEQADTALGNSCGTSAAAATSVVPTAHAAPKSTVPSASEPYDLTAGRPGVRLEKLTPIRRVIADRMMRSLQSTAQLTSVVEVDVSAIVRMRMQYKAEGRRISYLPFFTKAAVDALQVYPVFNTTITGGGTELLYHEAVNLGIAVDSPKGLMVPVIRDAQLKGVEEISSAIDDVADRVRSGRISSADLDGGTFTLTNTGSRGALFDTPILNYPQTAILGTGAVVERVVPIPGEDVRIGLRSFAYFALTYDHRVVDGADAARFLAHIKARIEAGTFEHLLSGHEE